MFGIDDMYKKMKPLDLAIARRMFFDKMENSIPIYALGIYIVKNKYHTGLGNYHEDILLNRLCSCLKVKKNELKCFINKWNLENTFPSRSLLERVSRYWKEYGG